jgi:hypothetical protein
MRFGSSLISPGTFLNHEARVLGRLHAVAERRGGRPLELPQSTAGTMSLWPIWSVTEPPVPNVPSLSTLISARLRSAPQLRYDLPGAVGIECGHGRGLRFGSRPGPSRRQRHPG